MVNARDLGSRDESRGGSNPSARTTPRLKAPQPGYADAANLAEGQTVVCHMQVTETLSEGLKREFQVQVPAADLEARVIERLGELKDRVQLRGFRPGNVPVTHLRKFYGRTGRPETIRAG